MKSHKSKRIVIFGVLGLFLFSYTAQAQIKKGALRKDIMQSKKKEQAVEKQLKNPPLQQMSEMPEPKPVAPIVNPLSNPNATIIYLEHAKSWSYDKERNTDVQVLKGDVRFRHDNAILYCDSAYYYEKANSLDAFSNVKIVQGDTLFVYGDYLFYDGNLELAKLRHHVRMVNRHTILTTDSLNYNRKTNLAYYYNGGKIVDQKNTLTSRWGQYSTTSDFALFKDSVKLVNKDFTMHADTLTYNTKTKVANIVGPTHINYKDETSVYSKNGWYNTVTDKMMLINRSLIIHHDGKTLTADTIFYDKNKKYGESFGNVILKDSNNKTSLEGDYVYYNDSTKKGLATDSALLVDWTDNDTIWVHADTLLTYKDSIYNVAKGYNHVRIFRNDIQGVSDSLIYSSRDSVMNLYGEPVLWTENNQLSGEIIRAYTHNKKVEKVKIEHNAIASEQLDSIHFNQLSGKEIVAYIDSSQLKKVDVNGNAETIYYPMDDADSILIGINKTESSFVVMYIKNKRIQRVVLTAVSNGIMYPIGELSGGELYLKNFFWLKHERPLSKKSVLINVPKEIRKKIGTSTLTSKETKSSGSPNNQQKPSGPF